MSNDKTNANPTPNITSLPEAKTEAVEETKVRFAKTKVFVQKHKSRLIAGTGLVALVGAAAIAGRATAPSYDYVVALEAPEMPELELDVNVEDQTA